MIDYMMVRKTDHCLVKDVKVISSEEYVPPHRMVIGRLVILMKPHISSVYSPFSDRVGFPPRNTPFPVVILLINRIGTAFSTGLPS